MFKRIFILFFIQYFFICGFVFAQQHKYKEGNKVQPSVSIQPAINLRNKISIHAIVPIWEYLTVNSTRFSPVVFNQSVFHQSIDGKVSAISIINGELLWETQPSGRCTTSLGVGKVSLYLAVEASLDKNSEGILRSIDFSTGLTRWSTSFSSPINSTPIEKNDLVYIGTEKGSLCAVSALDGSKKWENSELGTKISYLIVDQDIIYVSGNNGLYTLDSNTGKKLWTFNGKGEFRNLICNNSNVYVGSSSGYIYVIDKKNGKLKWQRRFGASIQAIPLLYENYLFIGSFDNFIYALSAKNGELYWRQQMVGRLTSAPILMDADTLIVGAFDADEITFIELKTGDVIARSTLGKKRILGNLIANQNFLIVPTNESIIATPLVSSFPIENIPAKK